MNHDSEDPRDLGGTPEEPPGNHDGPLVEVALAGLWRERRGTCELLVTRRPPGVHLAGCWELPGGKIEPGESVEEALRRELTEEIGFSPGHFQALLVLEHAYADRTVRLHAMTAEVAADADVAPAPDRAEHRWLPVEALGGEGWPEANAPITAALRDRLLSRNPVLGLT